MNLFTKHLLRSIKKSPFQPIIILLSLTVSVLSLIASTKMVINVCREHEHRASMVDYVGDITVKPSSTDESRIMFKDDAEELIGENGSVLGQFTVTGLISLEDGNDLVTLHAADLLEADEFYDLKYLSSAKISKENLDKTVIISSTAAEKYGLSVGDSFSVQLLNKKLELTVGAIAVSEGILRESCGILSIKAIARAIAEANPQIAALGDSDRKSVV